MFAFNLKPNIETAKRSHPVKQGMTAPMSRVTDEGSSV